MVTSTAKSGRRLPLVAMIAVTMLGCEAREPRATNHITGEPNCSGCTIQMVPLLTLQSNQPAGGPRFPATVVKLDQGGYVLAPTYEPGTAAVFHADGRVAGILGRFGEGPGEMKNVQSASRWFGDSIAIAHDRNRISVFDPSLGYVRSLVLNSSSFLTNDIKPSRHGALLARRTGTAGGSDFGLREFSSVGEPLRGFGTSTELGAGRIYAALVEANDTLWAADAGRYAIDVFTRDADSVITTVTREADWFPTNATRNEWGGLPAVQDFVRVREGMFLVLLRRPRPDYRVQGASPPSSSGAAPAARQQLDYSAMLERFEQVIELLDVRKGEVVAQLRIPDRWIGGFIDDDELYSYETDSATGEPAVGIWRVEIAGLPSGR